MQTIFWALGKTCGECDSGIVWEIEGIFESEQLAVSHCKDHNHFVGPLVLNEKLPEERTPWTGSYYPIKP